MPRAVVLVSGGLDSCVTAAGAAADFELCFLHLNYRQRTEKRELQAFDAIADHYPEMKGLRLGTKGGSRWMVGLTSCSLMQ